MNIWLNAVADPAMQSVPKILVTVAKVVGSGPREPGAKMLVTNVALFDTIGGGHLEMCATKIAREMLAMPTGAIASQRRLERFPLGPGLGQCCGGVVHLAFERIADNFMASLNYLKQRRHNGRDSWRFTSLDASATPTLTDEEGKHLAGAEISPHLSKQINTDISCQLIQDEHGQSWLLDTCLSYQPQLMIFGAGHVGAAIVRALADLPCQITWIDEREDMFPSDFPENVRIEATDTPEALIITAPQAMSFLVLTHSHALDQNLSEHILRRADFRWFGLIGSHTKRKLFEHRLGERGIPASSLSKMACPIGLPGIRGKQPAVIAASVVAQLLQIWEASN